MDVRVTNRTTIVIVLGLLILLLGISLAIWGPQKETTYQSSSTDPSSEITIGTISMVREPVWPAKYVIAIGALIVGAGALYRVLDRS